MATPIKDTPVLTGNNARQFDTWLTANATKKVSHEETARIQAAARKFRLVNDKTTLNA